MDFTVLLQPKYWLTLAPVPLSSLSEKLLAGFFAVVFIAGIVARMVEKKQKFDRFKIKAVRSLSQLGLTMGAVGLLLFFFAYENIRLFGARFWYPLWIVGVVIWLIFIWRDYYKVAPALKAKEEIRQQQKKYLPKKKK
jgi:type IV secretory pathway TrbD component